ncbi:hypothetical protein Pcinc_001855 [Petrolisthes cinctipes]|uniref:Uncharacterized protein n=1 Tax=Petrolisthes cinctipes TaxID=88211 RepID=A0AAE1GM27_PETCI|nr:hypothetical protein Pcinc_001855 [Petrolisthes cinctipes]
MQGLRSDGGQEGEGGVQRLVSDTQGIGWELPNTMACSVVKTPTPPLADTSRFSAFFAHSAPVLRQTGSPDKVMGQWAGPWVPSPLVTAGQGDHGSAKLPHDEPASNTSAHNSPQRKQQEEEEEEEEKGVMTLVINTSKNMTDAKDIFFFSILV